MLINKKRFANCDVRVTKKKKKSDSSSSVSVIAIELKTDTFIHTRAYTTKNCIKYIHTDSHTQQNIQTHTYTHMQHLSPRRDQIKKNGKIKTKMVQCSEKYIYEIKCKLVPLSKVPWKTI